MQAPTFTKTGSKATSSIKLNDKIFGLKVENTELLKKVYLSDLAKKRSSSAKVKTRTEVSGGGRKPWRQKGTGNARAGSIRSPLWRGGGITFGPTGQENYKISVNNKEIKLALKQALSISREKIYCIENIPGNLKKTKEVAAVINKTGARGKIIVVVDEISESNVLPINNLKDVYVVSANNLNSRHVIDADFILINKSSFQIIENRLGDDK